MLDPVVITMILAIAAWDAGVGAGLGSPGAGAWGVALPLGFAIAGALRLRLLHRRLARTGRADALFKADRTLLLSRAMVAAAFAVTVFQFGWIGLVRAGVGDLVLVDEALSTAPALVALALLWWAYAPIDERIHEAVLMRRLDLGEPIHAHATAKGYVIDRVRHQMLLTLAPIAMIAAWTEAADRCLPRWLSGRSEGAAAALTLGVYALGIIFVLLALPPIVRRIWTTTPLAGGPTRKRLDELCRRHRVKCREILVWRTRSGMANAAVMGIVGRFRYILLTDALLERLSPAQVEAVMAHEVAHVRRTHLPWMMLSLAGAIGVASFAGEALARGVSALAPMPAWATDAVALAVVAAVGVWVFGIVSRRFERQADAFAVQHLSGLERGNPESRERRITEAAAQTMAGALLEVARLNHAPVERFTWRHGSILGRTRAIAQLVGRPIGRVPIDRTVGAIKAATLVMIALVVLLAVLENRMRGDQAPAEANSSLTRFQFTTLHHAAT